VSQILPLSGISKPAINRNSGLARPRGSQQGHERAGVDFKADLVNGFETAKLLGYVLNNNAHCKTSGRFLIWMSNSIILNRDGINLQFTDEITVDLDKKCALATDVKANASGGNYMLSIVPQS